MIASSTKENERYLKSSMMKHARKVPLEYKLHQTQSKRNAISKAIDVLIALVVFMGFAGLIYYAQVNEVAVLSSDNAFPILAGQAMFHGNPLLTGWVASTRSYYFDSFVYGLFGQWFGYNFRLIYPVSAIALAILFSSICYIVLRLNKDRSIPYRIAAFLLSVSMCIASIYMASDTTQNNWAASHVFAAIAGLALMWNMYCAQQQQKVLSIGLFIALVFSVLTMGDYLLLYFAILPCALALGFSLIGRSDVRPSRRLTFVHLGMLFCVVVLNRALIGFLEALGGMPSAFDVSSVQIVPLEEIQSRLYFTLECILTVFNCNICGKIIDPQIALQVLVCVCIGILLLNLILKLHKVLSNFLGRALFFSMVISVLVLCFTSFTQTHDALWDTRLMYYFFFSAVILSACIGLDYVNKNLQRVFEIIRSGFFCAISVALLISGFSNIYYTDATEYEQATPFKVVRELESLHLTQGYGTFWLSNVMTLASEKKVTVVGIVGPNPTPFRWLAAPENSILYGNFILIDDTDWGHITSKIIYMKFGEPDSIQEIDGVKVLIYNKNLYSYMEVS